MKKWWFCAFCQVFIAVAITAQENRRLVERLDSALRYTEISDIERLLDFTYPRLFTIASREDMITTLKSGLDNEEFSSTLDSVRRVKVFPVFEVDNGLYAKVTHTMRMNMKFKMELDSTEVREFMLAMKQSFGEDKVKFDQPTNTVRVSMLVNMVAVKDKYSPEWSFLTFDDDEDDHELGVMLFPPGVLEKLKTYQ